MKLKTNPPFRTLTYEETAARAKQIWEQNGMPDGRDVEFWLEAERQLNSAGSMETMSTRKTSKASTGLKRGDDDGLRSKTNELLGNTGEADNRSPTSINLGRS